MKDFQELLQIHPELRGRPCGYAHCKPEQYRDAVDLLLEQAGQCPQLKGKADPIVSFVAVGDGVGWVEGDIRSSDFIAGYALQGRHPMQLWSAVH